MDKSNHWFKSRKCSFLEIFVQYADDLLLYIYYWMYCYFLFLEAFLGDRWCVDSWRVSLAGRAGEVNDSGWTDLIPQWKVMWSLAWVSVSFRSLERAGFGSEEHCNKVMCVSVFSPCVDVVLCRKLMLRVIVFLINGYIEVSPQGLFL